MHPLVYVFQLVPFVWGSVLFGTFLYALRSEFLLNGFLVTPRFFWCSCLCVSSFIFILLQLDPLGALDMYPPPLIKFLEWVGTSLLLDSVSCALYLYLIVLYQQHLAQVPRLLFLMWSGINLTATFLVLLVCVIGSASNNYFWYGICIVIVIVHELLIAVLLNVSLSKITSILKTMSSDGSNDPIFKAAIRKIRFVRLVCTSILCFVLGHQLFGSESFLELLAWGQPIPAYPIGEFVLDFWIPPILLCAVHTLLLYTLRRPQQKPSTRVDRIDPSTHVSTSVNP